MKKLTLFSKYKHALIFPLLLTWYELSMHISDGMDLKFSPIYILFAFSLGFILSALLELLPDKAAKRAGDILAVFFGIFYAAEFTCNSILQTYYPFSVLGTAAENKLFQFIGIIVEVVLASIPKYIFILLPVFVIILSRKSKRFRKWIPALAWEDRADVRGDNIKADAITGSDAMQESAIPYDSNFPVGKECDAKLDRVERSKQKNKFAVSPETKKPRWTIVLGLIVFSIIFHLLGLAAVMLPNWDCGLLPKTLYNSDTDYNDQVEELGIYNFIRLDIKHSLFGAKTSAFDASALEALNAPANASGMESSTGASQPAGQGDPNSTGAPDQTANQEKVIDTSPQVMDVDFAALSDGTSNKDIKWLLDYFSSVTPTNKNEYTGMFEGYNVVFITVEAASGYALDPKYTPTLWKMAKGGFVFNNFYTALHYTSTSNGECQNLLGLYPKNGNPISIKRTGELGTFMPFALAQQLGRQGYKNWGYHNNWDLYGRMYSHSNLGYYWQFEYNGLHGELKSNGELEWPQKDTVMVDESVDDFATEEEPFNVYYLTVAGHTPFGWNWANRQYKDLFADSNYTSQTNGYIASMVDCDRAVKKIVDALDESGKLEKTLFVIAPDHIPYSNVEILEELSGKSLGSSDAVRAINEQNIDFELYHSGLIIWSASMTKPVQVDKVCCQVDILPTVSNLLGLEYDSRMLSGTDALSSSEGLVIFSSKCWKSDRGFYNRFTQTFTPSEGVSMSEEQTKAYVEAMKTLVQCKLDCTAKIIENDFYNYVFGGKLEKIEGAISPHN